MNIKTALILVLGILMFVGFVVGVCWIFVFIFCPTIMNFKILIAGWVAYFLFGFLIPDDK